MNCPNGSRRKAGSPDYFIVPVRDVVCSLYGQSSLMCAYASGGLGPIIPNAIVDTNSLCSRGPGCPQSLTIADFFGTGWIQKLIDLATCNRWNEFCECIPDPNAPPQAGQCECIEYESTIERTFQQHPNYIETLRSQFWGPFGGMRKTAFGQNAQTIEILCRGPAHRACLPESQWIGIITSSDNPGDNPWQLLGIRRVDGLPDNCGGPTPIPPPQLPPPPAPPSNLPPAAQPPISSPGPAGLLGHKGRPAPLGRKGLLGNARQIALRAPLAHKARQEQKGRADFRALLELMEL